MGMQTRYLGALTITPSLCQEEVTWLRAHQQTEFALHPHDPYPAAMNPRAERAHAFATGAVPASGTRDSRTPRWVDWAPSVDGTHLRWQEADKSNAPIPEITYLIEHFLKPGAHAASDGRKDFEKFTFDHVVEGTIAAERSDGRLYLIEAVDNVVREIVLVRGAAEWGEC